ncbi:MAG: ribosome biogenesis GTPase Der [SAR324 cluster bacterium]|nr:ribosome biogenesis GTPase Der [SAR324 cluster bacterium]
MDPKANVKLLKTERAAPMGGGLVIALVGRPNVGKSSLFNRLAGGRNALVAPMPGVTRDRREAEVRFGSYRFRLIDTGGRQTAEGSELVAAINVQIETAAEEADCIWQVLDVTEGLTLTDEEIYRWLLRLGKPLFLIANKADNPARAAELSDFFALGSERIFPLSALHGIGVEQALEAVADLLPELTEESGAEPAAGEGPIRVALLGRPNVGKSSLVNAILGHGRMIVSPEPGTTREAVDLPLQVNGRSYLLMDTAGIRRRARTKEYLEKIGVLSSLKALRRSDVAVLLVDVSEPVAEQDARLAGYVLTQGRALVVAMNKWDLVEGDRAAARKIEEDVKDRLRFAEFAPRVRISARTGFGLPRLFQEIGSVYRQFCRAIQTADLNRVTRIAVARQAPPAKGRGKTRVFYGSQVGSKPPAFCFFTNHPEAIRDSYSRFFENQLRFHFGFKGTPLHLEWRGRREGQGRARTPKK